MCFPTCDLCITPANQFVPPHPSYVHRTFLVHLAFRFRAHFRLPTPSWKLTNAGLRKDPGPVRVPGIVRRLPANFKKLARPGLAPPRFWRPAVSRNEAGDPNRPIYALGIFPTPSLTQASAELILGIVTRTTAVTGPRSPWTSQHNLAGFRHFRG